MFLLLLLGCGFGFFPLKPFPAAPHSPLCPHPPWSLSCSQWSGGFSCCLDPPFCLGTQSELTNHSPHDCQATACSRLFPPYHGQVLFCTHLFLLLSSQHPLSQSWAHSSKSHAGSAFGAVGHGTRCPEQDARPHQPHIPLSRNPDPFSHNQVGFAGASPALVLWRLGDAGMMCGAEGALGGHVSDTTGIPISSSGHPMEVCG